MGSIGSNQHVWLQHVSGSITRSRHQVEPSTQPSMVPSEPSVAKVIRSGAEDLKWKCNRVMMT
uniref:Uncharacterized protein n=1 Tax=Setaria italica TaxID=4555 RepID=K3ZKV9_SETIT